MWELFRDLPELRAIALTGGLTYAALSAFWASLAFYVESDVFHAGPSTAGLFGLIGAGGALAANLAGRNVERFGARRIVQACIGVMLAGYAVFVGAGATWAGLIVGVVLLDLGAQAIDGVEPDRDLRPAPRGGHAAEHALQDVLLRRRRGGVGPQRAWRGTASPGAGSAQSASGSCVLALGWELRQRRVRSLAPLAAE